MGIFTRLADIVANDTEQDPLGVNAVIKLYGQLGSAVPVPYPTIDMKFQILVQLERILAGGDEDYHVTESLKQEAIAAVGLTGGNGNNLQWLLDSSCGRTFTTMYGSLGRDSKVVWFHALAQILQGRGGMSSTDRDAQEFYECLESGGQSAFVGRLVTAAKSHSVEMALAALSAMIKLANYDFGVQVELFSSLLSGNFFSFGSFFLTTSVFLNFFLWGIIENWPGSGSHHFPVGP